MPRHAISKKVCRMPKCKQFLAFESEENRFITISVEEYEVVRLLDYQGFTQEQTAEKMGIARTTVQLLYNQARKSISKALVEGVGLIIEGGSYYLCNGKEKECNCGGCEKHKAFAKG